MLPATQFRNRANGSLDKDLFPLRTAKVAELQGRLKVGVGQEIFGRFHHLRGRRLLTEVPEIDHPQSAWLEEWLSR